MANPFVAGNTANAASNPAELPIFKEYAWDFTHDTFRRDGAGRIIEVAGNDALKVWIYKLLRTPRYRHLAYYDDYGIILEDYIGRMVNDGADTGALFADIKDAILVNPYVESVVNGGITRRGKLTVIELDLETVYGVLKIELEV